MRHVSLPLLGTVASSINTGGGGSGWTIGAAYMLTESLPITGVRFFWKLAAEATPETVKLSLWDSGGTRLASVTVSVTASGVQEAYFASPYTMPAYNLFRVSFYNATRYPYFTTSALTTPLGFGVAYTNSTSIYLGGYLVWCGGCNVGSASDANPNASSNPASLMVGIEPITSPER